MPDLAPGDRVIYRDGDRYLVARIDIVGEGYHTAFPFDPLRRRWLTMRRRIARDFILDRLPATVDVPALVQRIEALRNQREAKRQQANRWLARRVRELAQQEEST